MSGKQSDSWVSESSPDDLSEESWVFIRNRPEFRDVKPIPQYDGRVAVAPIAYSEKFKDVHDYLRGLLKMGELSERALQLTEIALSLNAANYTTWKYRRDILRHLRSDVMDELNYVKIMIPENVKTYQVWHHCQRVLEWIGEPLDILDFIAEVMKQDSKNYHAWQLRQWVLLNFKCSRDSKELEFIDRLLEEDVRNNSAWNHRYFINFSLNKIDESVFATEIEYTLKKIRLATNNESAWNYLRGVLTQKKDGLSHPEVQKLVEELYRCGSRSPQLIMFMVDKIREDCDNKELRADLKKNVEICSQFYKDLATKYDKIRCRYWTYLHQEFSAEFETEVVGEPVTEIAS